MKRILLFIFFVVGLSVISIASEKLIWQIGQPDKSCSEFALFPDKYENFAHYSFGGEDKYYVIGQSGPQVDWPFVLPGPFDDFAGYGYWAGRALHKLPVFFEIDKLPGHGDCLLSIEILAVNAKQAPLLRCLVNGQVYEQQLVSGGSRNLENLLPNHQSVSFSIPVTQLKKGVNEIAFQNMTGNWFVFDAISFSGPSSLQLVSSGNTLLRDINFADWEQNVGNEAKQPLLIDLYHKGKKETVRAVIDGLEEEIEIEEGHHVLEFNFPAVKKKQISKVQVFVGNKLKYESEIQREPEPDITCSDYVSQFMGTSGSRWMITPGPRMPMPMVQLSPNNEQTVWKGGYEYQIESISGFNHTQEWTMAGFTMMPVTGKLQIQPGPENAPGLGYRSRINKKTEKAEIGLYHVDLVDYDIQTDLTATTRCGFQRYVFPESKSARVLINAYPPAEYSYENTEFEINRVSNTRVEGFVHQKCDSKHTGYAFEQNYRLHFVLEFNKPFKSMGGWTDQSENMKAGRTYVYDNIIEDAQQIKGGGMAGAFINFENLGNDTILVRSSISLVSTENAGLNLLQEISEPFGWDFEGVVQHQKDTWNDYLSRISIETSDYLQKVKFYTNLYRALSGRPAWGDVNGQWMDMNEHVQQFDNPQQRLCSGEFWNTFWNVQQLNQLIAPEFSSAQVKTLIEFYDKGGWLSKGIFAGEYSSVMVAMHSIPWIVGAWNHGIRDFNFEKAYAMMKHAQLTPPEMNHSGGGRVGNESLVEYMKYGYVPVETNVYQSYVSNTLEYAFDDWCLAQAAKQLGKEDDYLLFLNRSENWRNIFDSVSGFMRPRTQDGKFVEKFDPYHTPGFVEGNAWQFSWFVPHNVSGLVKAIGKKRFVERLDSAMYQSEQVNFNALGDNFSRYPVNHGNQPNMQSCYLFNWAGEPWLTQKWTRAIQEKYYGIGPRDAYLGDEDQGQMSSWFVMSSIGLFQMDGGCATEPTYELGSPRFEKVTIHLSDKYYSGKTFIIEAKNASKDNKYILSAKLNGKKLNSWKIPVKEVINGGKLEIEMSTKPNKSFGKKGNKSLVGTKN